MLQVGDVLMTEGGDPDKLGRGCVWNEEIPECIHQNHIFAVRPIQNKMRPKYLAALLESHYAKIYFLNTAKQTTNLASKNKKVVLLNKYGFTGGLLTESFDCYQKYDMQSTSEIFNKFFYDLVNRRRSILFDDGKYLIINPESIKLSLQALIEEYEIETLFHINPFRIKKQKGDIYIIDLIAREGIISFSSHNLIDTTDNYTLHSLLNRKPEISEVKYNFFTLTYSIKMRIGNVAAWINQNCNDIGNEIYDKKKKYNVVIFVKSMENEDYWEAIKIKKYGGKVIFDANVNYYDAWGYFGSYCNKPTIDQYNKAVNITKTADLCIADSSVLKDIVSRYNPNTVCIPDNVNLNIFRYTRKHRKTDKINIIWSGVSQKADHLIVLENIFSTLNNAELILVSDKKPKIINRFREKIKCHFVPYSDIGYAYLLSKSDILVSPKYLDNSYDICHTEYKIALGMAAGLPVVASPQKSYIEAINHQGGGFICSSSKEWINVLNILKNDHKLRRQIGKIARATIERHYSTKVIASRYRDKIIECLKN